MPLILAALVYGVMLIWHLGANAISARLQDEVVPVDAFMADMVEGSIPRVSGTAVFLTRTQRDVPPVMVCHIKHNRALHERLFVLTGRRIPLASLAAGARSHCRRQASGGALSRSEGRAIWL